LSQSPNPSKAKRNEIVCRLPAIKPAASPASRRLSVDEFCEREDIGHSTAAHMRTRGDGPIFLKIGRRVVYRLEDVEAWEQSRARRSTSDRGD
jgi:hypothetical protein